jgi:ABC-type phosphate transport system substrate-binding protein
VYPITTIVLRTHLLCYRPIVLAYNVPEVTELTLSQEAIVGIYNGTVRTWDHPAIRATNPGANLPPEGIKPVARYDKSGMTEIFTNALSHFSPEWASEFGTFDAGVDENGTPVKWDPEVVQLFAKRVYGVTDTIKEQKYSIGYSTPYLADLIGVLYASVINKHGNAVQANQESVQSAMDGKMSEMTDRLTVSLVDAPGSEAYPIVDFTYMIVRMESYSECESYIELVRYIQWLLTNEQARSEAEQFSMITVSENLAQRIQADVVEQMTCSGENIFKAAEDQRNKELISLQTWRLPVAIVTPFVGCIIIALCGYLLYQRVKYLKALDNNAWDIAVEDITFIFPYDTASIGRSRSLGSTSSHSDGISVNLDTGVEQVSLYVCIVKYIYCNISCFKRLHRVSCGKSRLNIHIYAWI